MKFTQRVISTLAIGSMALSATPAFATSLGVGASGGVSVANSHRGEVDSHSKADVHASSSVKFGAFTKVDHGKDDGDDNGKRRWYGSGSTATNTGAVVARLDNKIDKSLSLTARIVAAFSKKVCAVLGNRNGTSLTACMAEQKAKIKAAFSLKLDAAFGN